MENNKSTEISPKKEQSAQHVSGDEHRLPPLIFQHENLIHTLEDAHKLDQEGLARILNHINFVSRHTLVLLRHPKYKESIIVKAYPEPCLGFKLICHWSDENLLGLELENYQFMQLIIDDGLEMILVPAVLEEINREGFTVKLPDTSYITGKRQARRYACEGIVVELAQSGLVVKGKLLDFNPVGFRISLESKSSRSLHWLNSEAFVTIFLRRNDQILFSGVCKLIRQQGNFIDREIVITPENKNINRFKKRLLRNRRQRLTPSPTLTFDHPIIKKRVQLDVSDISTSGFSVYEESNDGVLMTGMVIPELSINFAGASRMKCSAQVIYRMEEKEKGVHCGLAILDMDINAYTHLTDILINALDPNGYVSNEIDMDDLWEFFFNSGFIYPKKYELIKAYREDFKKTYQKLYKLESPEIVKHFTYQKNGRIYGHLSMIRAYERSWLIQHHASRAMEGKRAGFMVLRQIVYFMNDVRRLPSPKVKYLICHYRPDNKFPDRVFGGFARSLNNSGGCSMDLFSYLYFINPSVNTKLPEGWLLSACSELDLWELNRFYSYYSNGLLLNSLCMGQNNSGNNALTSLYDKVGLKRRYKEYSLSFNGELNAVLIVDQSDLGLNLSEFLNAIKVLVTNPEGLPWDILSIAIARLATLYKKMTKVPILIYPMEYVNKKSVVYEKEYQIWILDLDYGSEFVEYMETRFRVSYK